jgi:hypothetical protein
VGLTITIFLGDELMAIDMTDELIAPLALCKDEMTRKVSGYSEGAEKKTREREKKVCVKDGIYERREE